MNNFPYSEFVPLGKKELHIRREKEISQFVSFYLKFKELAGREKALACVSDGKGEYICARSWVPFYSDRLSYIAYSAWYECRINGENVVIQEFQENRCEVPKQECFSEKHVPEEMCVSAVTYAELMYGVEKGMAVEKNRIALSLFLSPPTVLEFHASAAERQKQIA